MAEGGVAVAELVAEVVGGAAEGVDVAEVLAEGAGDEAGDDGEVFVVAVGEASDVGLGVGEGAGGGGSPCRLTRRSNEEGPSEIDSALIAVE